MKKGLQLKTNRLYFIDAVGLAQFRRLDTFLDLQKKHYSILRHALEPIDGVTFRTVPSLTLAPKTI